MASHFVEAQCFLQLFHASLGGVSTSTKLLFHGGILSNLSEQRVLCLESPIPLLGKSVEGPLDLVHEDALSVLAEVDPATSEIKGSIHDLLGDHFGMSFANAVEGSGTCATRISTPGLLL